jgi:hypothetical protein
MGSSLGREVRKLNLDEKMRRLELNTKLDEMKKWRIGKKLNKNHRKKDIRDTYSYDVYFEPNGLEEQVYTRNANNVFKQLDRIEKDARSNMELETEKAKYHLKNGDKK